MEHCPPPSVHTPYPSYFSFPTSPFYQNLGPPTATPTDNNKDDDDDDGASDQSSNVVLKSEDPTLDDELLNLKLERLRLLEQIRETEKMENSSLLPLLPDTPETQETSSTTGSRLTDEEFAQKLLHDELTAIKQTGKTQEQIQKAFTHQVETLLQTDPNFAQNLSNLEKDENFARLLEKQYLQNITLQIDEDERLARKLMEEDQGYAGNGSSHIPIIKKKTFVPKPTMPVQQNFQMNKTSPERRKHAIEIHNRYCSCKKITPGNNGHLFKIHDENCGCIKLHCK